MHLFDDSIKRLHYDFFCNLCKSKNEAFFLVWKINLTFCSTTSLIYSFSWMSEDDIPSLLIFFGWTKLQSVEAPFCGPLLFSLIWEFGASVCQTFLLFFLHFFWPLSASVCISFATSLWGHQIAVWWWVKRLVDVWIYRTYCTMKQCVEKCDQSRGLWNMLRERKTTVALSILFFFCLCVAFE